VSRLIRPDDEQAPEVRNGTAMMDIRVQPGPRDSGFRQITSWDYLYSFLRRYQLFFLYTAIIVVSGAVSATLGVVVGTTVLVFFLGSGRHDYAVALFLLVLFFSDSRQPNLAFFKDLRVPVLLFLAVFPFLARAGSIGLHKHVVYFVPFFLFAIASLTLRNPDPALALAKTLSYLLLVWVVFQYLLVQVRLWGTQLLLDVLLIFSGIIGLGLLAAVVAPDLAFMVGRFRGLLGNPNGMGVFAVLSIPYIFVVSDSFFPQIRLLKWGSLGLVYTSLFLSGSRSALAAVGVFSLLYFLLQGDETKKAVVFGVLLPLMVFWIQDLNWTEHSYLGRLQEYLRIETFAEGSGRFMAWAYAIDVVKQFPWVGGGFGFDEFVFDLSRVPANLRFSGHQGGVHNSYLSLLLNTGVIGLLLFFGYLGRVVMDAAKGSDWKYVIPFISAVLISISFESWMMASLNALTVVFFLNIVVFIMRKELLHAQLVRRY